MSQPVNQSSQSPAASMPVSAISDPARQACLFDELEPAAPPQQPAAPKTSAATAHSEPPIPKTRPRLLCGFLKNPVGAAKTKKMSSLETK